VASSESSGGAGDRVGAGHGGVPGQRDPAAGRRGRNAGRPPGPAGRGPRAQRCGPPPPLPVGPGARLTGWSGWWGEGAAGRRGGLRHRGAPVVAGDEHDPRSWAAAGAAGRGGRRPAGDPARAGGRGAGGRSRRLAGGRRRCRRAGVVPGRPAAGGWAATRAAARGRVRGRRHGRSWAGRASGSDPPPGPDVRCSARRPPGHRARRRLDRPSPSPLPNQGCAGRRRGPPGPRRLRPAG